MTLEYQSIQEQDKFKDKLLVLRNSLASLVEDISNTNPENPPEIYLFGSLGRRIAISNARTWDGYEDSITKNSRLAPRKSLRNLWDADIAVPNESAPWPTLANISRKISKGNDVVEIDPHFIDVDTGNRTFMHGDTLISTNYFKFELKTFDFVVDKNLSPIKVPDMWSQLLFYLTSKQLRPRDMTEIKMLTEGIIRSGDIKDKSRSEEAINIARNNKKLISLKNMVRWPYWIAVPYPLRVKIAKQLRHNQNADIRGYERPEPVYF